MNKLWSCRFAFPVLGKIALSCVAVCSFASAQIAYQDQEIQVHNLRSLTARTHDASDILLTSLDTILNDRGVCCGKDSALEDSAQLADPASLADVASRLQGKHRLSDGRAIRVATEYITPDKAYAGYLVKMILDQHAAILQWNSHLYVVHGIVFFWTDNGAGGLDPLIHKLLLWDTRYSDSRREVTFTRDVDDASKIQGWLFVRSAPE